MRYPIPPDDPDLMPTEVMDMLRQAETFSSSRWLSNATINGDLTIKDSGNVTIDDKNSVLRVKGGSIMLRDGVIKGNMLKNQIRDASSYGGFMVGGTWTHDNSSDIGTDWTTIIQSSQPGKRTGFDFDSWVSRVIIRVSATLRVDGMADHDDTYAFSAPTVQMRIRGGSGGLTWTSPVAYASYWTTGNPLSIFGTPMYPEQSAQLSYGIVDDVDPAEEYKLVVEARSSVYLPQDDYGNYGMITLAMTELR